MGEIKKEKKYDEQGEEEQARLEVKERNEA
jgi:hypothetical protein